MARRPPPKFSRQRYNNVISDAVISGLVDRLGLDGVTFIASGPGNPLGIGFLEAKATNGTIGLKTGDFQIQGHIAALSGLPIGSAAPRELWLVTTADSSISSEVVDFATERGVTIVHSTTVYDPDTGKMRVLDGRVLNPETAPNGGATREYPGGYRDVDLIE